jgi:hypothetical protein
VSGSSGGGRGGEAGDGRGAAVGVGGEAGDGRGAAAAASSFQQCTLGVPGVIEK